LRRKTNVRIPVNAAPEKGSGPDKKNPGGYRRTRAVEINCRP